jgi:hypothetical protein
MGKWNNTPEGTATAFSSCGEFDFDIRTGKVTRTDLTREFGRKPIRVDVPEHTKWYRSFLTPGFSCDVLGLAYWDRKGYHPACADWRKELLEHRVEDAMADSGGFSKEELETKKRGIRFEREFIKKMDAMATEAASVKRKKK